MIIEGKNLMIISFSQEVKISQGFFPLLSLTVAYLFTVIMSKSTLFFTQRYFKECWRIASVIAHCTFSLNNLSSNSSVPKGQSSGKYDILQFLHNSAKVRQHSRLQIMLFSFILNYIWTPLHSDSKLSLHASHLSNLYNCLLGPYDSLKCKGTLGQDLIKSALLKLLLICN